MVGGVKFQLISGDITTEDTDVIVNTTDFSLQNQTGAVTTEMNTLDFDHTSVFCLLDVLTAVILQVSLKPS